MGEDIVSCENEAGILSSPGASGVFLPLQIAGGINRGYYFQRRS